MRRPQLPVCDRGQYILPECLAHFGGHLPGRLRSCTKASKGIPFTGGWSHRGLRSNSATRLTGSGERVVYESRYSHVRLGLDQQADGALDTEHVLLEIFLGVRQIGQGNLRLRDEAGRRGPSNPTDVGVAGSEARSGEMRERGAWTDPSGRPRPGSPDIKDMAGRGRSTQMLIRGTTCRFPARLSARLPNRCSLRRGVTSLRAGWPALPSKRLHRRMRSSVDAGNLFYWDQELASRQAPSLFERRVLSQPAVPCAAHLSDWPEAPLVFQQAQLALDCSSRLQLIKVRRQ